MKNLLIAKLIETVLGMVDADTLRRFADRLLDLIEKMVRESKTPMDDRVVLPLIASIRLAFGIPDDLSGQ